MPNLTGKRIVLRGYRNDDLTPIFRWANDAQSVRYLSARYWMPQSTADVADLTQPVAVDTEAHLVAIPMREGQTLESVHVQAVANDVLFGVMGASVLK